TLTRRLLALFVALCLALTACSSSDDTEEPVQQTDSAPTTSDAAPTTADSAPTTAVPDTDEQTATAKPTPTDDQATKTSPPPTQDKAKQTKKDEKAGGEPLPDGNITALVIGNDSRSNDFSGRSDVIVLVQLTEDREHLNLVSF